jgi:hypothetical protein
MIIVVEECQDMSTYIQTYWVIHLRVSLLLNMSSLDQRERDSKSGSRKSQNNSIISLMLPERSKTLPVVYRKVSEDIRSNRSIYGKSRIRQKVKPQRWTTMGQGPTPGRPHQGEGSTLGGLLLLVDLEG